MPNNFAIDLTDVHLNYDKQIVLSGLSLRVRQGEVFGILGRIGAGKTRILRLIAGLEKPTFGTIKSSFDRQGYIFQHDLLIPWLTVADNLRISRRKGAAPIGSPLLYDELKISDMQHKKPAQLSGGMRKKVNFVRAFINEDPLILMDEPFGALDPFEKSGLQKSLLHLLENRKITAVMVSHDIQDALLVCHRVGFLSSITGNIVWTAENPFQGRTDTAQLYADPTYRQLTQKALDLFSGESP